MSPLNRLERYSYGMAFLLFLAGTARFGWVVTRHAGHTPNEEDRAPARLQQKLPSLAELQRQIGVPLAAPSAVDSVIAEAIGSVKAQASSRPAEYIKSYLAVQAGPPRSELRVDGVLVGRTPYVGQITCERGRTVKIDVLPPTGMPKAYQIPCLDGEMRLRDEP